MRFWVINTKCYKGSKADDDDDDDDELFLWYG